MFVKVIRRAAGIAPLVAFAIASHAAAQTDWVVQAPNPFPAKTLPEVGFFGEDRGFMVGLSTPLYSPGDRTLGTTNGGQSWQAVNLPNVRYSKLCIIDDQHGWAFGSAGGSRTTDGGVNWQPLGFVNNANQVVFRSPTFGWISDNWAVAVTHNGGLTWLHGIVGNDRVVYPDFANENVGVGIEDDGTGLWRTTNGGQSWTKMLERPYNGYDGFHTVRFLDANTVIVVGYSKVFRSTDGGQTWTEVLADASLYLGGRITAFDDQTVLISRSSNGFLSTDAGASWTPVAFPYAVENITHRGGLELYAGNAYGQIVRSSDAGLTWELLYDGPDFPITSFAFRTNDHIIAAGSNMLIESFNGGAPGSWALTSSGSREHVTDIAVSPSGLAISTGQSSTISRAENNGEQWVLHRDLHFVHAWCVELVNDTLAFVGGQQGWPLRSTDGGVTWEVIGAGTAGLAAVRDFSFVTDQLGWAASGYNGTGYILKTSDGGDTWIAQEGPVSGDFRSIHFFNETTGLALHSQGVVVRTTNGGQSWMQHSLPNSADVDMSFAENSLVGWTVGAFGAIAKTTNGGITWTAQNSGTTDHLFAVSAVSETEAWAGGSWATLRHTTDGGQSWQPVTIDALTPLNAHFAVNAIETHANGAVWVAGSSGFIFHRPGEPTGVPGDLNGDGIVNVQDLLMVISNWGSVCDPGQHCPGDANSDGIVNVQDLLLVISNWG